MKRFTHRRQQLKSSLYKASPLYIYLLACNEWYLVWTVARVRTHLLEGIQENRRIMASVPTSAKRH